MAATPSTMLPLGTRLPAFRLRDLDDRIVSSDDMSGSALLVAFICPHCPFVKHIRQEFARFASEYAPRGLAVVAINSNDSARFPQDGPEGMREEARIVGYSFPYLLDERQEVARNFHAACTPDLFLFDASGTLVYRGQFDDSRPGNDVPVTGADLRAATDAVLSGKPVAAAQKPSVGCNIKWRPGNEPGNVQS
jgi:thiol-disulfide isomerase/thioredoxin